MCAQEFSVSRFVELCLGVVVSETLSYFTHTNTHTHTTHTPHTHNTHTNTHTHTFGSRQKKSKFAQTTGTFNVFNPQSEILRSTSRRASACQNLHE
jgi:hypothetical protein